MNYSKILWCRLFIHDPLILLCHILNEHAEPSVFAETIPDQSETIMRFEVVYFRISMADMYIWLNIYSDATLYV